MATLQTDLLRSARLRARERQTQRVYTVTRNDQQAGWEELFRRFGNEVLNANRKVQSLVPGMVLSIPAAQNAVNNVRAQASNPLYTPTMPYIPPQVPARPARILPRVGVEGTYGGRRPRQGVVAAQPAPVTRATQPRFDQELAVQRRGTATTQPQRPMDLPERRLPPTVRPRFDVELALPAQRGAPGQPPRRPMDVAEPPAARPLFPIPGTQATQAHGPAIIPTTQRPGVPVLGQTGLLQPGTGSNIGSSNIVDYLLAQGIRPITIGANDPLILNGTLNALLLEQLGYAQDEWGNWVRLGPAVETTKDVTYANGGGGGGYGGGRRPGGGAGYGGAGRVPGYTGNDRYSSAIGLVSWRI